jgi:RNA polymerase sigma factor (sigma-70 family)
MKTLIEKFKSGDTEVYSLIYSEFEKLIGLYASRLKYEDAVSELTLFLIELLFSIDLSKFDDGMGFWIKRYIAVSIKNRYIALSIKNSKYQSFNMSIFDNSGSYLKSMDEKIILIDGFDRLSQKQRQVLVYMYIYGYSICEISKIFGISRQAVNDIKNRALINLKKFLKS